MGPHDCRAVRMETGPRQRCLGGRIYRTGEDWGGVNVKIKEKRGSQRHSLVLVQEVGDGAVQSNKYGRRSTEFGSL